MATMFQDDDGSMSSPDPLNDSIPSSLTRRITRSQRSQQFVSLGAASASPRRQTFELEVGNNRSPQKLFVTVESAQKLPPGLVPRRLFGSPTPNRTPVAQRRQQTTTTSVPLRDIDESDEDASGLASATPKRRGRPRKYAPTPMPGASLKKRAIAASANKATPGRPRKSGAGLPDEAPLENSTKTTPRTARSRRTTTSVGREPASDATIDVTPASTRAKRGAKRKAVEEEPGSMAPPSTKKKRGRPRKTPAVVEEVEEAPEEDTRAESRPVTERDSIDASPAALHSEPPTFSPPAVSAHNAVPESEGDIWMDTLSDGPTPRRAPLSRSLNFASTALTGQNSARQSPELRANDEDDGFAPATDIRDDTPSFSSPDATEQHDSNIDDMLLVPQPANEVPSDIDSEPSHGGPRARPRDPDTIVQSEDFSMIFMESLPPMEEDPNAVANLSASIGERTNLFINKTIQSIRNGMQSEQGDDGGFSSPDHTIQRKTQQEQEADEEQQEQHSRLRDSPHREVMEADEEHREQHSRLRDSPHRGVIEADEEHREQHSRLRDSPHRGVMEADEEHREQHSRLRDSPHRGVMEAEEEQREQRSSGHESPPQDVMEDEARHYEQASHSEDRVGYGSRVEDHGELPEIPPTQGPVWEAEPSMAASQYQQAPAESPQPQLSPVRVNSSPGRSGSPRRTKALPLSRQLLSFKAIQSGRSLVGESPSRGGFSPSRSSPTRASANAGEESNLYDDSFSAIPDAILEAATPHRPQHADIPSSNPSSNPSPAEVRPESQGKEVASPALGGTTDTIRSDNSRLLTPEETPSPNNVDGTADPMPMDYSEMELDDELTHPRSASPVLGNHSGQSFLTRRAPVQDKATPVVSASSPRLPARSDGSAYKSAQAAEEERRPTLSPIVRAGLALQSVTSDQSSPVGARSTLGSPFKASVNATPRLGSARPSGEVENAPTPRLVAEQLNRPPSSDDPFGPSRISNGQASFMAALDETARQLEARRTSRPGASSFDSTRATFDDADEMSWMAEDTIPAPTLADTLASRTSSLVANFSSVEIPEESADARETGDVRSVDNDVEEEEEEEEEDIWVTEAQRPTPNRPRQQAFGSKPAPRPTRRAVIPDTWRRSARDIPAATTSRAEQGQLEEYSLLSQQLQQQQQSTDVSEPPQGSSATKPSQNGALDLSKFFSSPAELPPQSAKQARAERSEQLRRAARAPAPAFAPNSMFPSVPQKEFHPSPARRNNRLFSSAASASVAATSVAEHVMDSSPTPGGASAAGHHGQAAAAPSTPERSTGLPAVEQKQNFTPRRGQASQSLFAPTSSAARSAAATATPPQMQLSRDDIERWQEETSVILDASSVDEPRVLRPSPGPPESWRSRSRAVAFAAQPLPHKTMSPSKSCLRSPLKPRTPGRVVEFASEALSPLEQASARAASSAAQRRRVAVAPVTQPKLAPPPPPPPAPTRDEDKENSPSEDASTTDASPPEEPARKQKQRQGPNEAVPPARLSQKTWTRDHWLLLDTLLQLRRRGPFAFNLGPAARGRSEDLVGRMASAGGETMRIEDWHLDVVDAFRAEVGGWDEGVLAKRVFALVVGEERRAEGRA